MVLLFDTVKYKHSSKCWVPLLSRLIEVQVLSAWEYWGCSEEAKDQQFIDNLHLHCHIKLFRILLWVSHQNSYKDISHRAPNLLCYRLCMDAKCRAKDNFDFTLQSFDFPVDTQHTSWVCCFWSLTLILFCWLFCKNIYHWINKSVSVQILSQA